MMLLLGLFLCPISVLLILNLSKYNVTKKEKIKYNSILFFMSIMYLVLCFIVNMEPFKFEIDRIEDYLIYSMCIFIFSPFLWINTFYVFKRVFKTFRVKKNFKAKSNVEFTYYRDYLNKITPSIVMLTSNLELDNRKSVTSSILKLKLTGFIEEKDNKIVKTNKSRNSLLESEKLLLDNLKYKELDTKEYDKLIEEETIKNGYLKKNTNNKLIKIVRIIIAIIIPIVLITTSFNFDKYVFDTYKSYVKDGKRYVLVGTDIGDIGFGNIPDINDYYHGEVEGDIFYDKALIRADKFDNDHVLKTKIYQALDSVYMVISIFSVFVSLYFIIEELLYFNKGYKRTRKGTDLLNEAYGLKNYLKEFSDIKSKKEKDLVLWEYYLIYAVALGINIKLEDKLIEKYFN